jgi:hypothetical protein
MTPPEPLVFAPFHFWRQNSINGPDASKFNWTMGIWSEVDKDVNGFANFQKEAMCGSVGFY